MLACQESAEGLNTCREFIELQPDMTVLQASRAGYELRGLELQQSIWCETRRGSTHPWPALRFIPSDSAVVVGQKLRERCTSTTA